MWPWKPWRIGIYLFQCYPQITTTLTFAEYTDDSRTATKEVTPGLSEVMMLAGAKTPTEYAIEEIDPYMLRELIQAIYVEAPDKSSGKRRQNIHIKYDGIGFIPLEELMKHE